MIPHITRGGDMPGLLGYLATTESRTDERANQHEHPRVVGGEAFLSLAYTGDLSAADAKGIADYLDRPRLQHGTEVTAARWEQNGEGERVAVLDRAGVQVRSAQHVWHCSLSLADGERLTPEAWGQVSAEFADRMGFTGTDEKSPARWVAVQHGDGKGGHDHVHIVASTVREDGTKWSAYRDFPLAQAACRELEREHGLVQVTGREAGTALPRFTAAEKGQGRLTDRDQLAEHVRAAAVASTSEAEWVRRVRAFGVIVKPRYAKGSTTEVVGYRVALGRQLLPAPPAGEAPPALRFYGGGQVGRDLTLPRLREMWEESADGPAAAEWAAAQRGTTTLAPEGGHRESKAYPAYGKAREWLDSYTTQLRTTPVSDRAAWSRAARDVSGALAAWAKADPTHADQLNAAAAVVARAAQDRRAGVERATRPARSSAMGAALVVMSGSSSDKAAAAALMAQLLRTAAAIADFHRATRNLREAAALDAQLAQLRALPGLVPAAVSQDRPAHLSLGRQIGGQHYRRGRDDHGR